MCILFSVHLSRRMTQKSLQRNCDLSLCQVWYVWIEHISRAHPSLENLSAKVLLLFKSVYGWQSSVNAMTHCDTETKKDPQGDCLLYPTLSLTSPSTSYWHPKQLISYIRSFLSRNNWYLLKVSATKDQSKSIWSTTEVLQESSECWSSQKPAWTWPQFTWMEIYYVTCSNWCTARLHPT